ncbi:MAG: response regulator [Halioglobus sp.]|nr:response regulator [Halioglobus sp.]
MSIVFASKTLRQALPEIDRKPKLKDIFDVVRPSSFSTFSEGYNSIGSLCLLVAQNNTFAIRGQLISMRYSGKDVLCFCGAPWLSWIQSKSPQTHLRLDNFSAQDVQLDQLFFISAEAQMVSDLERLNEDLKSAKIKLEQSQSAQQLLFAHMSHEIRTPLNGVVSALALLGDTNLSEESDNLVRLAKNASQNLMHVVNYVLNVSKLELSPIQDLAVIDFKDLIQSTVEIVIPQAEEKSLKIDLHIASELPSNCYSSADKLKQTLLNLLVNAVKFTHKGAIRVSARPLDVNEIDSKVRIEVADTGVGIAEQDLSNVFKPFWSSQPVNSRRNDEGTGLGLDIVKRNVQSMGGKVSLESTVGKGTRIWFDIPVSSADEVAGEQVSGDLLDHEPVPELHGKVLLVDDNETNLVLGALILESMGIEVVSVNSGRAAVDVEREEQFDLVLMDISMPVMDGLEATRRIRAFSGKEHLPILALTAHIEDAEKQACLDSGMNGYLLKPIDREALYRELSTWLVKHERDHLKSPGLDSMSDTPTGLQILDHSILDQLVSEIGCDNVRAVIAQVQTESESRWAELIAAERAGDKEARQRNVHSLASIYRSVGLTYVGDSLGKIELLVRADGELQTGWLEDIEKLKTESMRALTEHIEKLSVQTAHRGALGGRSLPIS